MSRPDTFSTENNNLLFACDGAEKKVFQGIRTPLRLSSSGDWRLRMAI